METLTTKSMTGNAMTVSELQWLVGTAATFILAVAGIAIGAFRAVSNRIDSAVEKMQKAVKEGDDQLHDRISRVRDDMQENYVRRVDLDSHMKRHDDMLKEIRDDQKQIIRQMAGLEARGGRA